MNGELLTVLEHLEREKRIQRDVLIKAIEASLLTASKKRLGKADVSIKIDPKTADIRVFANLTVVKQVADSEIEISLDQAKRIDKKAKIGQIVQKEVTPQNFGRIAAQTAKQVIIQKIREAEREIVFNEYKDRVGDIVNGIVRRTERGNIMVDLGRTEALLPYREQCPKENYSSGYRMRFLILDVKTSSKGPEIILSRTHPLLVQRLFELEVPEINEGTVEIKAVAREPGYRSKIAVESKLDKVDSVGACVGLRGERVKTIVHELNGEKIDIVRYNSNISLFVENALSPAKISSISLNEKNKVLTVSVNDDQFSLAIGKKGQNARLTSKLIGWKIDIKRVGDTLSAPEDPKALVEAIAGLTKPVQQSLIDAELTTLEKLEELTLDKLIALKGIGEKTAPKILEAIQAHVSKEKSKTKLDTIIAEQTKEMKKSQE